MPKRKHSLPTVSSKKFRGHGFWQDFGRGFFGTIGNPIGTVVSVIKGQNPSWWRANKLRVFDHRRGFVGGILSSLGAGYLKDALSGAFDAIQRKSSIQMTSPSILNYKLNSRPHYLTPNYVTREGLPVYIQHGPYRKNGIADLFLNIIRNPTVQKYGTKVGLTAASYLVPKAIDYFTSRNAKKKKSQEEDN